MSDRSNHVTTVDEESPLLMKSDDSASEDGSVRTIHALPGMKIHAHAIDKHGQVWEGGWG